MEAVQLLDDEAASSTAEGGENNAKSTRLAPKLRVRVDDLRRGRDALIKRRVDNLVSVGAGTKNDGSINDYILSSIDGNDGSDDPSEEEKWMREEKVMRRIIETPAWLPPLLAAFAATSPVEVPVSDWKAFKTDVLAGTNFACTSWEATDVAAIYRGRLPRASRSALANEEDDDQGGNSITAAFEEM